MPAGQTLLRALRSKAKVTTRYGGGFVQSIEGVEGSARRHEDWFWFVNGLAGDRSATSYRLRDGDVAWWDYRDWSRDADTLEVVAGAFPEPFLHGYDGKARPAAVRYGPGLRAGAERVARVLGTEDVAPAGTAVARGRQPLRARRGAPHLTAVLRSPGSGTSGAVRFSFAGSVDALLAGALRAEVLEPVSPGPATALLAAAATAAFLIDRVWALAAMTVVLLLICLRAPVQRRWLYISGALLSALGVIVISPLTWSSGGGTLLWEGPTLPVIGPLDLSTDEIRIAVVNGLQLAVVGLAFSAYTLLVDHDRLVSAAGFARRSALAVALATRLVPSLERDAAGLRRVGARPRRRAARGAGLRDAALAARRRVARAGDRPGRGDGGTRVRAPARRGRRARLDVDRPRRARRAVVLVGVAAWL